MGHKKELLPYYKLAQKMLGVKTNPRLGMGDKLLRKTAAEFGTEHTFQSSSAGIFFGEENKTVMDPYFNGEGPKRTGCNFCGGCMVGCRYNAKNSLDKNYLYFAEKLGATVIPETTVTHIIPVNEDGSKGYTVKTSTSTALFGSPRREYSSKGIIFAAGTLGTLKLLLMMKRQKFLDRLSPALGIKVLTNGESILGVQSKRKSKINFANGIAISSKVHPEPDTTVEAVNYSAGSNLLGLLANVFTEGGGIIPRPVKFIINSLLHPVVFINSIFLFGFAERTLLLLVMQKKEISLRIELRRRFLFPLRFKLISKRSISKNKPAHIYVAQEFAKRLARRIDGTPKSAVTESLFNSPVSAHILGGCSIADNRREGVIDYKNRVYGYKNMYVCDGSALPNNPGVNPSLSITAFAERAMSFIPANSGKTPFIFKFEKKWESAKWIKGKKFK